METTGGLRSADIEREAKALVVLGCGMENNFGTIEVSVDGFDGVFHDVFNAKGCSHVEDNI